MKISFKSVLTILALIVAGGMIAAVFILNNNEGGIDNDGEKLEVGATIFALYDIAKNVAGDNASVHLVLPPGASPHTFEFTPREISRIKNAKVIFQIGYSLDDWVRVVEGSIPSIEFIRVDKGIALKESEGILFHNEESEGGKMGEQEEHGPIDPHYWLHFGNARIITENIKNELVRQDLKNKESYEENALNYIERLIEKENELTSRASSVQGAKIITLHDAWFYFSDNFSIEVAGSFEPSPGKEPTPRYLSELLGKIKEENIKVIFAERQDVSMSFQNFARENNLSLALLDPIESGIEGKDDFIGLMEYNVNQIIDALGSQ